MRGPVVLARDTRFNDGFIYESAVIQARGGNMLTLTPSTKKPDGCMDVIYSSTWYWEQILKENSEIRCRSISVILLLQEIPGVKIRATGVDSKDS